MTFTIAPLRRDQASDYAAFHVELLNTTYAHLVDATYARTRRAELAERADELVADLDEAEACVSAGCEPTRRHWIAHNPRGAVVGIAASGDGVGAWERPHLGDLWTPPATTFTLDHLYVVPGAQGTGLAQELLDVAVPDGRSAFLWVFADNGRAIRFYERNGFVADGLAASTGLAWGDVPMLRMVRLAEGSG